MFFTIADLQHRLPVAPPSYDGRACARSGQGVGSDIPDGAVFTSVVSIGQLWENNRVTAYVYRGANGHFFVERIGRIGRPTGEVDRIEHGIQAYAVNPCVPRPRRR